ncbi:MAG: hypothetical protein FWG25_06140 [Promicromonosporaceae bacterium]|nr:hypothetical protein [Promicromonosporaceae bacterium]
MSRSVVMLPDGRMAIPLEEPEIRELGINANSQVDVRAWRGYLEATTVNPFKGKPLSELATIIAEQGVNQKHHTQ